MSRLYKIFIVALLSLVVYIPRATAITKLEFTDPVCEMSKKVQKDAEENEQENAEANEKLNEKERRPENGEGTSLFKKFVSKKSTKLVLNALKGQFNVGDSGSEDLSDSSSSNNGNLKLDFDSLLTYTQDLVKSSQKAKLEKTKMIHAQLSALYSERDMLKEILDQSPDNAEQVEARLKDIEIEIANLEGQSEKILAENTMNNEKIAKNKKAMDALSKQISNLNSQKISSDLLKSLNASTAKLFANKEKDDDAEDVYATNINKLFLGKYDYEGGDGLAKVIKARQQEYYAAVKNLGREYLNTINDIEKSSDRSVNCIDALSMADGINGQQTMQICVDLQNARVAAGYTGILIAQMRFKAISDIQSWTHMYKFRSYDASPTRFNLDNYIFQKKKLKFNVSDKLSSAMSNFKGF